MSDFETRKERLSNILYQQPEIIKVLLIEDNPGDARLVKEMLIDEGANKFSLAHVELIREGLSLLRDEDYQVILLDLSLPDGHGLDTIRQVCAVAPHLAIVILTGLDDETIAIRAVQEGVQDYLVKGQMDSNLLARAIRYAIERKRAEEKLRESEERYRTIIENIQDGYFEVDLAGTFTFVNDAECRNLGYSKGELIGMNYRQYAEGKTAKELYRLFNEIYRTGEPAQGYGFELIKKDGSVVFDEATVSLMRDPEGKPIGFRGIARDITERKRTEEKLTRNQEELIKKNKEIDESRRSLQLALEELEKAYKELKTTQSKILQQEKMASIGQLAAGVAHEINNPMAFISSNLGTLGKYVHRLTEFIQTQSEVIQSLNTSDAVEGLKRKQKELKLDYITEDIKGLITESLDGSERVKKIVQGLRSFARMDEAEHKSVDINECIESTLNIVWNELKYNATLKKDYGNIPLTKCYPQQMNQVFMNLLINAIHSIEKQGEIAIKTRDEDGSILIAISDTGHGIPQENLNRIFEPFFTTKEVGKGTGLGLSITYDIVQRHNGEITVESEVGKGTTFTIRLPIV